MNKKFNKKDFKKSKGKSKFNRNNVEETASKETADYGYHNDASWYIPDENLRRQVGSFSFSSTIGVSDYLSIDSSPVITSPMTVGNIMAISLFPYIGNASNPQGSIAQRLSINTAALKAYTEFSSINAKNTQYQPQDVAKAILAVGDLVSLVAFCQRAYGVAFTFNPRNRTIPKQLIRAMGIQPDSLLNNLAHYRMRLNKILTIASNVRMIKDIKYFDKCWEIYSHIFYDKNSAMGQYYVTRMPGYLKYVEDDENLRHLQWVEFGNPTDAGMITADRLLDHLENCVDYILNSSLFNYVFTDIVNYVTKQGGELLGFSFVPELYQVFPEFSETFMDQVHNMDWGGVDLSAYAIYDKPLENAIDSTWIFKKVSSTLNVALADFHDSILDFIFTDNPSVDQIIDACVYKRGYKSVAYNPDSDTAVPWFIAASDHPVLDVYMILEQGANTVVQSLGENGTTDSGLPYLYKFTKDFDVAPIFYELNVSTSELQHYGQLNYWTVIGYSQLANMFDYYRLGLFDVQVKNGIKPM